MSNNSLTSSTQCDEPTQNSKNTSESDKKRKASSILWKCIILLLATSTSHLRKALASSTNSHACWKMAGSWRHTRCPVSARSIATTRAVGCAPRVETILFAGNVGVWATLRRAQKSLFVTSFVPPVWCESAVPNHESQS